MMSIRSDGEAQFGPGTQRICRDDALKLIPASSAAARRYRQGRGSQNER